MAHAHAINVSGLTPPMPLREPKMVSFRDHCDIIPAASMSTSTSFSPSIGGFSVSVSTPSFSAPSFSAPKLRRPKLFSSGSSSNNSDTAQYAEVGALASPPTMSSPPLGSPSLAPPPQRSNRLSLALVGRWRSKDRPGSADGYGPSASGRSPSIESRVSSSPSTRTASQSSATTPDTGSTRERDASSSSAKSLNVLPEATLSASPASSPLPTPSSEVGPSAGLSATAPEPLPPAPAALGLELNEETPSTPALLAEGRSSAEPSFDSVLLTPTATYEAPTMPGLRRESAEATEELAALLALTSRAADDEEEEAVQSIKTEAVEPDLGNLLALGWTSDTAEGSGAVRPLAVRKPLAFGPVETEDLDTAASVEPQLTESGLLTPRAEAQGFPSVVQPVVPVILTEQHVEPTLRIPKMVPGHGEERVCSTCICVDCEERVLLGLRNDYSAAWSRGARRKYLADRAQRRMLARQRYTAQDRLDGVVPSGTGSQSVSPSIKSIQLASPAALRDAPLAPDTDGAAEAAAALGAAMHADATSGSNSPDENAEVEALGLGLAPGIKADEVDRKFGGRVTPCASPGPSEDGGEWDTPSSGDGEDDEDEPDSALAAMDAELKTELKREGADAPIPARISSPALGGGARAMMRQLEQAEALERKASVERTHRRSGSLSRSSEEPAPSPRMGAALEAYAPARPWSPPVRIGSPEAVRLAQQGSGIARNSSPGLLSKSIARVGSPSLISRTDSPPIRAASPGRLETPLRAPSPLGRTPSPNMNADAPLVPPVRAPSPLDKFHALMNAPGSHGLAAITEGEGDADHSIEPQPRSSAETRRLAKIREQSAAVRQEAASHAASFGKPSAALPKIQTPPEKRPGRSRPSQDSPKAPSAATRAAADRLPDQFTYPSGPSRTNGGAGRARPSTATQKRTSSFLSAFGGVPSSPFGGPGGAAMSTQRSRSPNGLNGVTPNGFHPANGNGSANNGYFPPSASSNGSQPRRPRTSDGTSPSLESTPSPTFHRSTSSTSATRHTPKEESKGFRGLVARLRQ